MPKLTVLPHAEYAPKGTEITAAAGSTIADALVCNGVELDHACGKVGACTTCHVVVKEGFDSLSQAGEGEEDMLDRAWGLQPTSRLACQARLGGEDLVVEIPRYSLNHAKESG